MPSLRSLAASALALTAALSAPPAVHADVAGLDAGSRRPVAAAPAERVPRAAQAAETTRPRWKRRIDRLVAGRAVGVSVLAAGVTLYERGAKKRRVPASNQKLIAAMALLERFDRTERLPTILSGPAPLNGVVTGDVWILGRGDPTVTSGGAFARSLPFEPTRIRALARSLVDAGVTRISGSIMGSTGYFGRDWWAPGWKDYYPSLYIALPSALTFNGNRSGGEHVSDPERRAAAALTKRLRKVGVEVTGTAGSGEPPDGLVEIARVGSPSMETLLRYMSRSSSNFFAEVLGKRLGVAAAGAPGTIAKGAGALRDYAVARNVSVDAHDSSGLSYANRVSARGLARLLDDADEQTWSAVLRRILPTGGQGTLERRLHGVRVRAKTGTLIGHSALSGYVWAERRDEWVPFAIISSGMDKSKAAAIEDRIVRILEQRSR